MALTKISRNLLDTGVSDSSDATAITIDSSERIGIGTTSPAFKLDVNGSLSSNGNENVMRIAGSDTNNAGGITINSVYGNSASARVSTLFSIDGQDQASPLAFGSGTSEKIRITSAGKVGIGLTSPQAVLDVVSSGATSTAFRVLKSGTSTQNLHAATEISGHGRFSIYDSSENEDVRFDSNGDSYLNGGNVGIGTTSGDVRNDGNANRTYVSIIGNANRGVLNLGSTASAGADGGKLTFVNGTNAVGEIYADPDSGSQTNGFMVFSTSNSERMRINSSGRVGIGTTSPYAGYKVSIDANANNGLHIGNIGNGYSGIVTIPDSSNNYFPLYIFNSSGNANGYILSNSSGTTFSTSGSDIAFKENVKNWDENVLESFKNIKPSTFTYKSDENKKEIKGYIAQNEVDKFPEAYPINPIDGKHWFNPSGMTVYLMKAIQELSAKVEELESKINE